MSKVKIKLLNDGGYTFLEGVNFPVEVNAHAFGAGYDVPTFELMRVGVDDSDVSVTYKSTWYFSPEECEVILK